MSSNPTNNNRLASRPTPNSSEEMQSVVAQATQMVNAMVVALREVHCYLVPKCAEFGVVLDAQAEHAWAMSLWITLSRDSKAHWKMPNTRFPKKDDKPARDPKLAKTELFPRSEQPLEPSKALTKVRQMMKIASLGERELLAVLRESGMKEALCAQTLSEIPDKVLQLVLQRWETICELIQAEHQDQPTYE